MTYNPDAQWTEWAVSLDGEPGGFLTMSERAARGMAEQYGAALFKRTARIVSDSWVLVTEKPEENA